MSALVFDAYGTLFDVHSVVAACEARFGGHGEGLSRLWRAKQLEYSWLTSLMGRYEDFETLTGRALRYACTALGLDATPEDQARIVDAYRRLDLFPDARAALDAPYGYPLAILSNGAPAMLQALVEHAGIGTVFGVLISVDELRIYKPDPRVYQHAAERLGLAPAAIGFVSANAWDACGAAAFGLRSFWVNRAGAPLDELGVAPAAILGSLEELAVRLATG